MQGLARKAYWRIAAVLTLCVLAGLAMFALSACSKTGAPTVQYHCPMHPTYISDKPGDCPICGMRLVPIDNSPRQASTSAATPTSTSRGAAPAAEHQHDGRAVVTAGAGRVWTCPMHPEVTSDRPGRCPKCGMPLEPKADDRAAPPSAPGSANSAASEAARDRAAPASQSQSGTSVPGMAPIDVDPEGLRLAGVQTSLAEHARISRTIRAVGIVRADETRIRHVHTKISGWVEKLYISFTGESVTKGRPILSIYSQELLATQQEYLRAREAAISMQKLTVEAARQAAQDMLNAARRRLELFDVPPSLIAELDSTGKPQRIVTLLAPVSGVVTGKQIFEGQQVEPGMELFTVSDLSRVWIEADVYENEANAVRVGQQARIVLPYDPGPAMDGKVKYIYPYLNPDTRTLKVRFDFPNHASQLRLDAFANVEIPVESDEGVVVPDSAIMDTGVRQVIFVNTEAGHFEPRQVKVGIRADGRAQVLSGVRVGERVAIKANFLLDSESRLRAAMAAPTH